MKQYLAIKAKYPDAVLLFRVGDFYETFSQDAIIASKVLGIVLTQRKNGAAATVELAGFPHHSLDTYLPKLVKAGYRVAICDQLENPKETKTIVKRGVTELVTPGVAFNDKVLDHKTNNFLAAIHFEKDQFGISFLDVTTGEFYVAQGSKEYIEKLLQGFKPAEVLYQKQYQRQFVELFGDKLYTFKLDDWVFTADFARELLLKHFGTKSLKGFGVDELTLGIISAGAAMHYLAETHHEKIGHITALTRIEEDKYVWLDNFTIRNLELVYSTNANAKTLIDVLDHSQTPMGGRLLKRWMVLPLKELKPIHERLDVVSHFLTENDQREEVLHQLRMVGDLERLISKVATARINPREVVQLKRALLTIDPIKNLCRASSSETLQGMADQLNPCKFIIDKIEREITDEAPLATNKGNFVKPGIHPELDDYKNISFNGKDYLLQIQEREATRTGITSLKIAYNNVFGYFIEVRNTHKDKVPADWIRKQTLVNAERYITEELKEYESKILSAEDKIQQIELEIFTDLVKSLAEFIVPIQLNSSILARLDVLISFAIVAEVRDFTRPEVDDSLDIDIRGGRHPVIETQLPLGEEYIANDVFLDTDAQQLMMITGPNMAGKSALLRQTALITLMAQMGSFVPAEKARIGLVDKIFTRVGASDNISSGESTFMVEMNETASILNNISNRSLILLDEIGRGTSTYDGISIAWAIAEYLHNNGKTRPKTLFATHYHELNNMAETFPRIKNFNVSVKEVGSKVIFLRKLKPGGSEHSFGIHVAKMAGMPPVVLQRAEEVLSSLELQHSSEQLAQKTKVIAADSKMQLSFFTLDDPTLIQIRDEIKNIDINTLTPVEALMKLNEIKKIIGG